MSETEPIDWPVCAVGCGRYVLSIDGQPIAWCLVHFPAGGV